MQHACSVAPCLDWRIPCARQAVVSYVIQLPTSGLRCSFIYLRLHVRSPWPSRTDHRHRGREERPAPPMHSRSALWPWIASSWVGGSPSGGEKERRERERRKGGSLGRLTWIARLPALGSKGNKGGSAGCHGLRLPGSAGCIWDQALNVCMAWDGMSPDVHMSGPITAHVPSQPGPGCPQSICLLRPLPS